MKQVVMAHEGKSVYRFGDFTLDVGECRLKRDWEESPLQPKTFEMLRYLVERPGHLVKKDELLEALWPDSIVAESALTQCIKEVRKALSDDAAHPRYIQTIHRVGYKFIAEVEELTTAAVEVVKEGPGQAIDSLAVLPFANLNADPEQDYFVEGMTDLLITDLGKIGALKVISRTSAMQYKETRKPLPEIARELKVNAVAEGSVLRVGERVRITVQLIEAATDRHLWAESYERDLRDILALQSEVAQAIAREIQVVLTPEEEVRLASARPVNPEAHLAYLKGCYFFNKYSPESAWKAIEYFQLAVEKDPDSAAAYAGLADAYGQLAHWGFASPREVIPKGKAAALKAVEMDETLSDAHGVLARLKFFYDWDWVTADREFQRALELNPGDTHARLAYSFELAAMGRLDEGMAEIRRAWELDPLSLVVNAAVGWHFYVRRHDEQAIEQWQKTVEMEPTFFISHWGLWRVFRVKGREEEALDECRTMFSLLGNREVVEAIEQGLAESGYRETMRRAAQTLVTQLKERYVPPTDIALLYAHAEKNDQAIEWLEKAYQERNPRLYSLGVEPDWEGLHPDPRFQNLLRRLNLPVVEPRHER